MAAQNRHGIIPLADITGAGSSAEVDMSTFQHAWLYFKSGASAPTVSIEAAPEEFGEDPSWFLYGLEIFPGTNKNVAIPVPFGVVTEYVIPSRIRVTTTESLTGIFIEGVRDVA